MGVFFVDNARGGRYILVEDLDPVGNCSTITATEAHNGLGGLFLLIKSSALFAVEHLC